MNDEFNQFLGVNFILRNLAKTSKPTIEVIKDGDFWIIRTHTAVRTSEIKFKIGEEFDEARMDGKTVKVRYYFFSMKLDLNFFFNRLL